MLSVLVVLLFFGDSFFIRFFTRNSTFLWKVYWFSWNLFTVFGLFDCLYLEKWFILSLLTVKLSLWQGWSLSSFFVISQFSNSKWFGECILSAALFTFLSKEGFIIFLFRQSWYLIVLLLELLGINLEMLSRLVWWFCCKLAWGS